MKGQILLRQANLDPHDRNVIIGLAGGDYSLQAIYTALRNAFRASGLPLSFMHTSGPRPQRRGGGKSKSRRSNFAQSGPSNGRHIEDGEPPLFYACMSERDAQERTSAIVDSLACASVVAKATLDAELRALNIAELKDKPARQPEHHF